MFGKRKPKKSMFAVLAVSSTPTPTPVKNVQLVEPGDDYEDEYAPPVRMVAPKKAQKKALPGERLLRQIHRDRAKERLAESMAALGIE